MSELSSLIDRVTTLNSKVDFWNNFVVWSLYGTALAAVAVVLCQRMVNVRAKQLGEAQAKVAEFKEDQLQKDLGDQKERTAALGAEAAAANERAAAIMQATAWRRITPQQRSDLMTILSKGPPGTIHIAWIANDPESFWLANRLAAIFNDAKWKLTESANTYPNALLWGIWIPNSPNADHRVKDAFRAANITFSPETPPQPANFAGTAPAPEEALVIIGSKRPAFGEPVK